MLVLFIEFHNVLDTSLTKAAFKLLLIALHFETGTIVIHFLVAEKSSIYTVNPEIFVVEIIFS